MSQIFALLNTTLQRTGFYCLSGLYSTAVNEGSVCVYMKWNIYNITGLQQFLLLQVSHSFLTYMTLAIDFVDR